MRNKHENFFRKWIGAPLLLGAMTYTGMVVAATVSAVDRVPTAAPLDVPNAAATPVAAGVSHEASDALLQWLNGMNYLEGRFKQTIVDAAGVELQQTEGEFKMTRPGKLYWQVAPPFEQLVVSNGETLWLYDPDLEQVNVSQQGELSGPAAILSGDTAQLKQYYHVSLTHDERHTRYILSPLTSASGDSFEQISLTQDQGKLVAVSMRDKLGQTTDITFNNLIVNRAIDDAVYNFVPPANTDVILDGQ